MTDFRALCAELAYELDAETGYTRTNGVRVTHPTVAEARSALAQPEPQGPTNAQIDELAAEYLDGDRASVRDFARAVLVRWWGNSIITPDGPAVPNGREPASVAHQPTDKELLEMMPKTMRDEFAAVSDVYSTATGGQVKPGLFRVVLNTVALEYARAAIARYGRPAIEPVPVAERLPGPEDCDAKGQVWGWYRDGRLGFWQMRVINKSPKSAWLPTHWLPYHALQAPQQEVNRG